MTEPNTPEEMANKNAVSYVKKHNFDEELLDFARACYYDGFKDGMIEHNAQTLDRLKEKVKENAMGEGFMYTNEIIQLIEEVSDE